MNEGSAGYSANVEMFLVLNGRQLVLGQLGPEHCIVREPEEFPPSQAEIIVVVDGNETRLSVYLPQGGSSSSRRVPYTQVSLPATVVPTSFVTH